MSYEDEDQMKIVIIGDSGVGKTCIIYRYANGTFKDEEQSTMGVDFLSTNLEYKEKKYRLQIWVNTAGQERYRTITSAYYRDAAGIIIVYDVTREKTFHNVKYWFDSIAEHGPDDAVVLLVGNKIDLKEIKRVTSLQGEELCKELECFFLETSAKEETNIDSIFQLVVGKILNVRKRKTVVDKIDLVRNDSKGNGRRNVPSGGGCACGNGGD